MSTRLTLICHAATEATRKADFPGNEPVEPRGYAKAASLSSRLGRSDAAWTSPALRATQTAAALGLAAEHDERLADIDLGRWAGRSLAALQASDPEALALWMTEPAAAPHGGESVVQLLARARAWLDLPRADGMRVIAVTHAAFIRAAIIACLDARASSFWRVDVAPLCSASFQGRPGRWTLRSCGALPCLPETGWGERGLAEPPSRAPGYAATTLARTCGLGEAWSISIR